MADQFFADSDSTMPVKRHGGKPSLAIVGTGIAGMSAAWALNDSHDITLFESGTYIGGHTNTFIYNSLEGPVPIDTGFIVYNQPNYPNLTALFAHLGIKSNTTRMHFSVAARDRDLEYSSRGLRGLFADKRNLLRPKFYRMLVDIMRFYRDIHRVSELSDDMSLHLYLKTGGYGDAFINDHLLPMVAAIWSCPVGTALDFPACVLARFFINHGLAELGTSFEWSSVDGGSASYIRPLTQDFHQQIRLNTEVTGVWRARGRVELCTKQGDVHVFDKVILACHAPQSARILRDAGREEAKILSAFRTQANKAVLHTDVRFMPRRRDAWASWNYITEEAEQKELSVTYWMNKLQRLNIRTNCFVTLNPASSPADDEILAEFEYCHPVFDAAAIQAQRDIWSIQGRGNVWYAGAWLGYGFHEDGLQAGLAIAEELSNWRRPWNFDRSRERLSRSRSRPDRQSALL